MDIKQLLDRYIEGMEAQRVDFQKRLDMLAGALGFARQLLAEIETGEALPPPETEE